MKFTAVFVATLASAATLTFAAPSPQGSGGACSTGSPQCCSTQHSGDFAKALGGLLGLGQFLGDLGLDCTGLPFNAVGGSVAIQNQCKATPLCCDSTHNNGLVAVGCTPLGLN